MCSSFGRDDIDIWKSLQILFRTDFMIDGRFKVCVRLYPGSYASPQVFSQTRKSPSSKTQILALVKTTTTNLNVNAMIIGAFWTPVVLQTFLPCLNFNPSSTDLS